MITTNGTLGFILTVLLAVLLSASLAIATKVHTDWVLSVRNKFAGQKQSLDALKEHDSRRHLRMLAGIDLPLGGDGRPNSAGFVPFLLFFYYYTLVSVIEKSDAEEIKIHNKELKIIDYPKQI